ncbi:hypothetical protein D3C74_406770 [compost metagenome]
MPGSSPAVAATATMAAPAIRDLAGETAKKRRWRIGVSTNFRLAHAKSKEPANRAADCSGFGLPPESSV